LKYKVGNLRQCPSEDLSDSAKIPCEVSKAIDFRLGCRKKVSDPCQLIRLSLYDVTLQIMSATAANQFKPALDDLPCELRAKIALR